ncbi:MAG: NUDIX hydrolase [Allosphingosinicella sp.]|uniref:NUDIX hydrolase n=1 Tax=Allosphingosinicella sp. TaxID=2823234 RepID=UPI00394DA3F3
MIATFLNRLRRLPFPWRRPPLQVGALPWRRSGEGGLEVLLVTSRGTGQWILPKGWPEPGRGPAETAAREAYEEAGVSGRIDPREMGRFLHLKSRIARPSLRCMIAVHPLAVERELADWPERAERRRRWFPAEEAAGAVRSAELAALIRRLDQIA